MFSFIVAARCRVERAELSSLIEFPVQSGATFQLAQEDAERAFQLQPGKYFLAQVSSNCLHALQKEHAVLRC